MRREFADSLHKQMAINPKIWLLTGDCVNNECVIRYRYEKEWSVYLL